MKASVVLSAAYAALVAATASAQTPHVSEVEYEGYSYDFVDRGSLSTTQQRQQVANAFYAAGHADAYDFLVVLPAFPTNGTDPGLEGADILGLHTPVRNFVQGIGEPTFESLQFGSPSRLLGVIDVRGLVPAVSTDVALGVLAHEIAHQWSGMVPFQDGAGQHRMDLLGQEQAHWSFFLDSDASVLYGSQWTPGPAGTSFTSTEQRKRYSPLDLYLMGVLPASGVPPMTLLHPAAGVSWTADAIPPPDGTQIQATTEQVTIQQIIAAAGPRFPDSVSAPHAFRAAFIVLTKPGTPATNAQRAWVDGLRRQWEDTFFFLTGGHAVMETELAEVTPVSVSAQPSVSAGLDFLLAAQTPGGAWADAPETAFRDTEEALEALAIFQNDSRTKPSMAAGADFLTGATPDGLDTAARRALGLVSAGRAASVDAASIGRWHDPAGLNGDNGFGYLVGYTSSPIDDLLAENALRHLVGGAASSDQVLATLLQAQRDDGGWSVLPGSGSDLAFTAEVLHALASVPRTSAIVLAANRAFPYFANVPWTGAAIPPATTAAVAQALAEFGVLSAGDAQSVATALLRQQRPDGSWGGSVHQTARVVQTLRRLLTPNLSATAGELKVTPSAAVDSAPVLLSGVVHNNGFASAAPVRVRAFDSSGAPFGDALDLGTLAPGQSVPFSVRLDTTGHQGSTQVFLVADPDEVIDELDESDNRAALPLPIFAPPSGPGLFIAPTVASVPAQVSRLPSSLNVSATVGNAGQTDASGVEIAVLVNGTNAGTVKLDLPARSTRQVSIPTNVLSATVNVGIDVVVDPTGAFRSGGPAPTAQLTVPLVPTVDVAVQALTIAPTTVDQGQDAQLSFTLANAGTISAENVTATVTLLNQSGAVVAQLPVATASIAPGQTALRSATWRANVAGTLTVRVTALAPQEADATTGDNAATGSLTVRPSSLANLAIHPADVSFAPNPPLEAADATVSANIHNTGGTETGSFFADLYLGDPASGGTLVSHSSVASIPPGSASTVQAHFTPGSTSSVIVVRLDAAGAVTEFDRSDDDAVATFHPATLPDLRIGSADIALSNDFPKAGDPLQVTVSVYNDGDQEALNVPVELFLGAPDSGGVLLGAQSLPNLGGHASGTASFSWSTSGLTGAQVLVAVVNRSGAVKESRTDNDRASRTVALDSYPLTLSNPYFSPNGDGIQDTTDVVLRTSSPTNAVVRITDHRGLLVRMLTATANGATTTATWDGRGDDGHMLPDGAYDLEVVAAGKTVGHLTATLDTNRTSLSRADDAHLIQKQPLYQDPAFLIPWGYQQKALMWSDDRILFYADRNPQVPNPDPAAKCGFYLAFADDLTNVQRITPDSWPCGSWPRAFLPSPDGDHVAIWTYYSLQLLTVSTGELTTIDSYDDINYFVVAAFSPDGTRLSYLRHAWGVPVQIRERNLVTGAIRDVPPEGMEDVYELSYAPDGTQRAAVGWQGWGTGGATKLALLSPDGAMQVLPVWASENTDEVLPAQSHTWLPDGTLVFVGAVRTGTSDDRSVCNLNWSNTPCDVYERYGVHRFDVHTGSIADIFVDDPTLFGQYQGYNAVAVSPDQEDVLFFSGGAYEQGPGVVPVPLVHLDLQGGGTPQQFGGPVAAASDLSAPFGGGLFPGPQGTTALVPGSHAYEVIAVHSLANLSARISPVHKPGTPVVTVTGTAMDLNFASYELAYRPLSSTEWTTFAHAFNPVREGLLAEWTPPGPGLYELALTVHDRAGNSRTVKRKTAWGADPAAVSNVSVAPAYVSPNGDAHADVATISYSVNDAATAEFQWVNASGQTVRTLSQTTLESGQAQLIWDGRDEAGTAVPDGLYRLTGTSTAGNQSVTVDTVPPTATVDFAIPTGVIPGGMLVNVMTTSGGWTQVPAQSFFETVQVADANPVDWTVEATSPLSPYSFVSEGHPDAPRRFAAEAVRGRTVRVRARDAAGNEYVTPAVSHPEGLWLVSAGPAKLLDATDQLILDGEIIPRVDRLFPWHEGEKLTADRTALLFSTSIAAHLVSWRAEHRSSGDFVRESGTVTMLGERAILWDARALTAGNYDVAFVATDENGIEHRVELAVQLPNTDDRVCMQRAPGFPIVLTPGHDPDDGLLPEAKVTIVNVATGEKWFNTFDGNTSSSDYTEDGTKYVLAIDPLPGCDFELTLEGKRTLSGAFTFDGLIHRCGTAVVSADPRSVTFAQRFGSPVVTTDVFVATDSAPPIAIGTVAATETPLSTVGVPALPTGVYHAGFLAHLADGSTQDSKSQLLSFCDPEPEIRTVGVQVTAAVSPEPKDAVHCVYSDPSLTLTARAVAAPGDSVGSIRAFLSSGPQVAWTTESLGETAFASAPLALDNLPEGAAYAQVTATADGGTGTAVAEFVVDRTPPVVTLSSPQSNSSVCPTAVHGPNGVDRQVVPVFASASDAHLRSTQVLRQSPTGEWLPAPLSDLSPPPGVFAYLDAPALFQSASGNGPAIITVEAVDASGSGKCAAPVAFTVQPPAAASGISVEPGSLAPGVAGANNSTSVSFSLNAPAEVVVSVLGSASGATPVIVKEGSFAAGVSEVSWDGTVNGAVLPDDAYVLTVRATGACGQTTSTTAAAPLILDRTSPVARIDSPGASQVVSGTFVLTGEASDAHLLQYTVSIAPAAAPETRTVVLTSSHSATGVLATVPVDGLPDGTYVVDLESTDQAQQLSSAQTTVVLSRGVVASWAVSPSVVGAGAGAVGAFALSASATVEVDLLDVAGHPLRPLVPPAPVGAGTGTLIIPAEALTGVSDGAYVARLTATVPAGTVTADAALAIDASGPRIAFDQPRDGATIAGSVTVSGSISDPRLASWFITLDGPGGTRTVASGANEVQGRIAVLTDLADGAYVLHAHAADLLGNPADVSVAFTSDSSAPVAAFDAPVDGAFVSGASGPVAIRAHASKPLSHVLLTAQTGTAAPRVLFEGAAIPADGVLAAWDVASEADGSATLTLEATDSAGNVGRAHVAVVVDNTLPSVHIDSPRDSVLQSDGRFKATVDDSNLSAYTVSISPGSPADAFRWTEIGNGLHSISSGVVATLWPLPADGSYSVRIVAEDKAGNRNSETVGFTIDTQPPSPATQLVATLQAPRDVALSWTASGSSNAAGYRVTRQSAGGTPQPVTPDLIQDITFSDVGVPDGTYTYAVVAVAASGLESTPVSSAPIAIDGTPPTVAIQSPATGAVVGGLVEVRGTAYSQSDFREYKLSLLSGDPSTAIPIQGGTQPVTAGLLGAFNAAALPQGSSQTLRLQGWDVSGNEADAQVTVTIDDLAPDAPVLTSVSAASGSTVVAAWTAPAATDLRGYLLYRNGVPVGAPAGMSFSDVSAYLLPAGSTSASDANVPDGTFSYQVQAVDLAGNFSPLSNALPVSLDTHPPHLTFASPDPFSMTSGATDVVAATEDLDVASVRFDVSSGAKLVTSVQQPAPGTTGFTLPIKPGDFPSRVFDVVATATDAAGHVDPNPPHLDFFVQQVLQAPVLVATQNVNQIHVHWSDPTPGGGAVAANLLEDGQHDYLSQPLTGTATASSTSTGSAQSIFQAYGDWEPGAEAQPSWTVALGRPLVLSAVDLAGTSYEQVGVDARVDGTWVHVLDHLQVATYSQAFALPRTVVADALRVVIQTSYYQPGLQRVSPWDQSGAVFSSDFDLSFWTNADTVSVTGIDLLGQAGPMATATVVRRVPAFGPLPSAVDQPSLAVTGSGAHPGSNVELRLEGSAVATVLADSNGAFSGTVTLAVGTNHLTAQDSDSIGNRSVESNAVTIAYQPPPSALVNLTLANVSGSNVTFGVALSGDSSGVTGIQLLRAMGGTESTVATLAPGATSYVDSNLVNGTYAYRARAVNGLGFTGVPSGIVTATVNVPVLAAPALAISEPQTGDRLVLSWTAPAGTTAVRLERADSATGAFTTVSAGVTGSTYQDTSVLAGHPYWYRAESLDALGNASAPSNIVSATPHDAVAPDAPVIDHPTIAGAPIVASSSPVDISGLAELNSTVTLTQMGIPVAVTKATTLETARIPLPLAHPVETDFALSPRGDAVAYTYRRPDGKVTVFIENLSTHAVVPIDDSGLHYAQSVSFSPDGTRVVYTGYDSANQGHVYLADVATGSSWPAVDPSLGQTQGAVWSPDSRRVAYSTVAFTDLGYQLGVSWVSADGGNPQPLPQPAGVFYSGPCFSADGTALYVTEYQYGSINRISLHPLDGSPSRTVLALDPSAASAQAVMSPQGKLAIAGQLNGASSLWVFDPADGPTEPPHPFPADTRRLTFSDDGQRLAFLVGYSEADSVDLGTWAQTGSPAPLDDYDAVHWLGSTLLAMDGNSVVSFKSGQGRFHFPAVALLPGDNLFAATAGDDSGNVSDPSAAISITYDAGPIADLKVADIALMPPVPVASQPASAIITVANVGQAAATTVQLSSSLLTSSGQVRTSPEVTLPGPLAAGDTTRVTVPLNVTGLEGNQTLTVTVDPASLIADSDRSNNTLARTVPVAATDSPTLALSVAPTELSVNDTAQAAVTIINPARAQSVTLEVALLSADGALVVAAPEQTVSLDAVSSQTVIVALPIGSALAGSYTLRAQALAADGAVIEAAKAPVTVKAEVTTAVTVVSERRSYLPGQHLLVDGTVQNLSRNAYLTGANFRVRLVDTSGNTVTSTSVALPSLGLGTSTPVTVDLGTVAPVGQYTALGEVLLGNQVLATASDVLEVIGQPLLVGTVTVEGDGNPAAVRAGRFANVQLAVTNSGTADAFGISAQVALVDPMTGAVLAVQSASTGEIATGKTFQAAVAFPTQALEPRTYAVVLSVAHDGQPMVALASSRFTITDGTVPALALLNLHQGMFVQQTLTVRVEGIDDWSGIAQVLLAVDGQPSSPLLLTDGTPLDGTWTVTLSLPSDGPHTLSFVASDLAGNEGALSPSASNPLTVTVIRDATPPMVAITGVDEGAVLATAVSPLISASDANLSSTTATLDGRPFTSGTPVTSDGNHVVFATATDLAGNQGTAARRFSIDTSAPVITVSGISDGEVVASAVMPDVRIDDAHPDTSTILLDEATWVPGTTVFTAGPHKLVVDASDTLGHSSHQEVRFTIDLMPPVIFIDGIAADAMVNQAVTLTFGATDDNLDRVTATLDGADVHSPLTVSADGLHRLAVHAIDRAGNPADASRSFTIDTLPPQLVLSGVTEGAVVGAPVTLTFTVTDAHPGATTATLDGSPIASGSTVSAEGDHTWTVDAVDAAANHAPTQSRHFTIDTTAPVVSLSGVADGAIVHGPVTLTFDATDTHLARVTSTLNGQPSATGAVVSADGDDSWTVQAFDAAGNASPVQTRRFTIDTAPPVVVVTGVASNAFYNHPVTPVVAVTEAHPATTTVTLDAAEFTSGTSVGTEGVHPLHASATDAAGNIAAPVDLSFTIDVTPPAVTISGVSDGAAATSFTPTYSATDANLDQVTATLDGAAFVPGTVVNAGGPHTLVVTATDLATNSTTRTVHFTVSQGGPTFHYAVCALGTLTVRDRAQVGSSSTFSSIAANGALNVVNNAVVIGDAVSGGAATTRNFGTITGSLYHGGSYTRYDSSVVSGGDSLVSPAPTPCTCGYDLATRIAEVQASNDNAKLSSDPAIAPYLKNGALTVADGSTVTLPSGRYALTSVSLSGNSRVTVASGASVQLFVNGPLQVSNGATLGAPASAADALLVISSADASLNQGVSILNTAQAALRVYAPKANVTLANGTQINGAIVGNNITLHDDDVLNFLPGAQQTPPALSCP